MKDKPVTRWQLRVNADIEKRIRALAESEHRSINQTVIHIITKYLEIVDLNTSVNKDSKVHDK